MKDSVEVHGEKENFEGVIVGFHPERSGFIYDGDFQEQDVEDIGYTLVLEVASINPNQIIHFPKKHTNKITSDKESKEGIIPVVKNSSEKETRTIVIQRDAIESANIRTMTELKNEAVNYLDTNYPAHIIWNELRGNEILCSGIKVNNMIIVKSMSIKKQTEIQMGDINDIKNIQKHIENIYNKKIDDEHMNNYMFLKVDNNIMNVSYYINRTHFGDDCAMEGSIELTDNGFRLKNEDIQKRREEYEPY